MDFFFSRNEEGLYFIVIAHQSEGENYLLYKGSSLPEHKIIGICIAFSYAHFFFEGKACKVGMQAAAHEHCRSCHRCSFAAFVTASEFYQDTAREAIDRQRDTALGFLTVLCVF